MNQILRISILSPTRLSRSACWTAPVIRALFSTAGNCKENSWCPVLERLIHALRLRNIYWILTWYWALGKDEILSSGACDVGRWRGPDNKQLSRFNSRSVGHKLHRENTAGKGGSERRCAVQTRWSWLLWAWCAHTLWAPVGLSQSCHVAEMGEGFTLHQGHPTWRQGLPLSYSPSPNPVASCNMMTSSESFSSILWPFPIHLIPKLSISPEGLNDSAPTCATTCDVFISLF